jgi:diguanylate cyclase (GGDEF)-like protein
VYRIFTLKNKPHPKEEKCARLSYKNRVFSQLDAYCNGFYQLTNGFRYYSSLRNSFTYKLFLYCFLTLAVMYAHRFLPSKVLHVVPSKNAQAYIYGDNNSSGQPMVSWLDFEHLIWQCNIENDGKSHSCGSNVALAGSVNGKGIDLSGYDHVNIDLDYSGGDKRLRFYARNYIEGFSDEKKSQTIQFSNALIPTQFINSNNLSINFSEFFVAEWWINDVQAPRSAMRSNFKHTVLFGVDLNYPTSPGLHTFHLRKLEFVGLWVSKERWYLGILIFWIAAIVIGGAYNLWQLKRQYDAEHKRLDSLISQNSMLENETNHYKQLSMLDQLTGLLNRHGLTHYIDKNFSDDKKQHVALIIIDIDFFKKINDTYGHNGGDIVLQKVAQVLRDSVRGSDYSARWGGEEFVIIMPNTGLQDASIIAEKLRALVELTRFDDRPELSVTISLGVGAIDEGIEPFHMLFRRVDLALYQAKAQGRNRVIAAELT